MELIKIEVEVGKESHELSTGLVNFLKDVQKAIADGYQPDQDFPIMLMSAVNNLIPAVQGMDQVDDEMRENKKAFVINMGIMAGDLWEALVPTPALPDPSEIKELS
jgi:hypothetical protein